MKKQLSSILGLLLTLLASGCSTGSNGIEFVSDAQLKPVDGSAATTLPPATPKIAKSDEFKVQVAIYGNLMNRQFLKDGDYSAVFVQGDDSEVAALIKQFPNHVPPIKPSNQLDLQPNQAPLDRQTGKPAMLFSVEVQEPVDDTVLAIGRWFAGSAVSGFYTFTLQKTEGEWVIVSSK